VGNYPGCGVSIPSVSGHLSRDAALAELVGHNSACHVLDDQTGRQALNDEGCQVLVVLTGLLQGPIDQVARQVVQRAGRWESERCLAEDLRSDALAEVLMPRHQNPGRICAWRPEMGSLAVWLRTVLTNLLRDRQRRQSKLEQLPDNAEKRFSRDEPGPDELCDAWPEVFGSLFSRQDLEQLAGWPAQVRIELLCLAGLSHKVPPEQWEKWLVAWELQNSRSLPRPFPPDSFLTLDEARFRVRPLANLLGCEVNTLSQRWSRHRNRLGTLAFVENLQPA